MFCPDLEISGNFTRQEKLKYQVPWRLNAVGLIGNQVRILNRTRCCESLNIVLRTLPLVVTLNDYIITGKA
jgi:hypothetical protein